MDTASIVKEIKAEIARLSSALTILSSGNSTDAQSYRPKRVLSKRAPVSKPGSRLTPAGRKRLSELMKQRWAERRRRAAGRRKGAAKTA